MLVPAEGGPWGICLHRRFVTIGLGGQPSRLDDEAARQRGALAQEGLRCDRNGPCAGLRRQFHNDLGWSPGNHLQGFTGAICPDQAGAQRLGSEARTVDGDLSAWLDEWDGADQRAVIDQEVRQPVAASQYQQHQQDGQGNPASVFPLFRFFRGDLIGEEV